MKRRSVAFALMLCAVVLVKLCLPVFAEIVEQTGEGYRASVQYIEGYEQPIACTITMDAPEDLDPTATVINKSFSLTTPHGEAGEQTARAEIKFGAAREMKEEDWQAISTWLEGVLSSAAPSSTGQNAEQIAKQAVSAIRAAQRAAKPDEEGVLPLWADPQISLNAVSVAAPYYATLERGNRSDDAKALQEQLILLGYLDGSADGQYGPKTADAVKMAESGLRAREQAVIDAQATPVPTPSPEPTPLADGSMPEAEPTPEPVPAPEPDTQVDGVADLAFLIRLYSDEFPLVDEPLQKGANADAVARLQRRLVALGCLTDTPDGDYGPNTRRATRIFQHYNGLEETGIADEGTQRVLFSNAAKAPENPLLTLGSSGDAVKKLQKRLSLLGFTRMAGADGDFGATTKSGVETLQKYMRAKEIEALTAQAKAAQNLARQDVAPARPDPTTATASPRPTDDSPELLVNPTIEVNGVADPLLLDAFYSDDFGALPPVLKNDDTGLEVERLQRRLYALEYLYTSADGNYGNGTESAIRAFQERNNLGQDGLAGRETLEKLFSQDALKALKPYVLKVSTSKQRVYAYGLDENGEHTKLVRTMKCSTGLNATPTPKGTYQGSTGPGARWHYFKKFTCWAQYAYYIQGDYMFHSVLYGSKGGSVTQSSVRNLGSKASHGCVRLSVEDAKWLWNNCPPNTKVVVY